MVLRCNSMHRVNGGCLACVPVCGRKHPVHPLMPQAVASARHRAGVGRRSACTHVPGLKKGCASFACPRAAFMRFDATLEQVSVSLVRVLMRARRHAST